MHTHWLELGFRTLIHIKTNNLYGRAGGFNAEQGKFPRVGGGSSSPAPKENSWLTAGKNSSACQSYSKKGKFIREGVMLHRQSTASPQRQRLREPQRDSEVQRERRERQRRREGRREWEGRRKVSERYDEKEGKRKSERDSEFLGNSVYISFLVFVNYSLKIVYLFSFDGMGIQCDR